MFISSFLMEVTLPETTRLFPFLNQSLEKENFPAEEVRVFVQSRQGIIGGNRFTGYACRISLHSGRKHGNLYRAFTKHQRRQVRLITCRSIVPSPAMPPIERVFHRNVAIHLPVNHGERKKSSLPLSTNPLPDCQIRGQIPLLHTGCLAVYRALSHHRAILPCGKAHLHQDGRER